MLSVERKTVVYEKKSRREKRKINWAVLKDKQRNNARGRAYPTQSSKTSRQEVV
jgi:hypothetical protein